MLAELEVYFRTNYSLCPKDTSFLADHANLSSVAHYLSMALLPFYVFGGYCILIKTPNTMKQVKWPLFRVFFWCTVTDFMITSLITPFFYFPSLSGFCLGILGQVGIRTEILVYTGAVCCWAMILSVSALFEDRFNSIPANDWKIRCRSTKLIYHTSRIFICLLYPLPTLIFSPDQELAKLETLKILPCPSPEFFTAPVFTLQTDGLVINIAVYFTMFLAFAETGQVLFFGSYCLYFLHIYPSRFVSYRTRRLQAHYFYAIVVQISVSATSLVIPFTYFMLSVLLLYHNQIITNLCVLFFAVHGFLSTVVVILIHAPYRNFAKSCLGMPCAQKKSSARQTRVKGAQLF